MGKADQTWGVYVNEHTDDRIRIGSFMRVVGSVADSAEHAGAQRQDICTTAVSFIRGDLQAEMSLVSDERENATDQSADVADGTASQFMSNWIGVGRS